MPDEDLVPAVVQKEGIVGVQHVLGEGRASGELHLNPSTLIRYPGTEYVTITHHQPPRNFTLSLSPSLSLPLPLPLPLHLSLLSHRMSVTNELWATSSSLPPASLDFIWLMYSGLAPRTVKNFLPSARRAALSFCSVYRGRGGNDLSFLSLQISCLYG